MRFKEKRVRMQLYKMHDYDLVKYYISLRNRKLKNRRIAFPTIMKELLREYVRGEGSFSPPVIHEFSVAKLPTVIHVRFLLEEEGDGDIIDFLRQIERGQINSFLKSLLRRNLSVSDLRCYLIEDSPPIIAEPVLAIPKSISKQVTQKLVVEEAIPVEHKGVQQIRKEEPTVIFSDTTPLLPNNGFNFFDAISAMVEN